MQKKEMQLWSTQPFSMEIQKCEKAVLHNSEISVGDSKRKVIW
jgi:hypothetical protein